MEYFEKKLTYLRGVCDGSGFSADTKEGKIFHGILEILDDMSFMLETFMDDEDLDSLDMYEDDEKDFESYCGQCTFCGADISVEYTEDNPSMIVTCSECQNPIPINAIDTKE